MLKKSFLSIIILCLSISFSFGQNLITIDSARSIPVGDTVTISGIITNGAELGTIRYIQDHTAGIGVYDWNLSSSLFRGDSVTLTGIMDEYNMLLEVKDVITYNVHSSGNTLPVPQIITPSQMDEDYEGEIVKIQNATFTNPGGTFSGNTNYMISSGGQQIQVRVNTASPLVGELIPTSTLDIVGIGSQFSYSNPNAGYQILLRDSADLISTQSIALTSPISVTNLTASSFDLNWTTDVVGSTEMFYGSTPALGSHLDMSATGTSHTASLTGLNAAELVYAKVFSVNGSDTAFSGMQSYITVSASSGDIKVYFTSTVDNSVSSGTNAIQLDDLMDDTLIAYIDRAQLSVDVSIYNFNNTNISNIATALNNAHNRGCVVRVVSDGSSLNLGLQGLDAAIGQINSPTSSDYGIMHNKFVVIDAEHTDPNVPIVWTGSMNFTQTGINSFANNVIILQDQSLARAYTLEFEEMYGSTGAQPSLNDAVFGPYKSNNTPHEFIIGGKRIECYFSPSDGVNEKIISTANTGDHEVFVNTMLITRSDIGYALRDLHNAGKDVKVLINNKAECSSTVVSTLENSLDTLFREFGESHILHHKLMIVDPNYTNSNPIVLTGCHNWSNSADQRNDENTLIIHDSTIANIYFQEFTKRWMLSFIGIEGAEEINGDFVLYPNPAVNFVNIEFEAGHSGNAVISIYDIKGSLKSAETFTYQAGTTNVNLPIDLESGLYLIKVDFESGSITKRLLVK